jgi:hypothetical protein
VDFYEKWTNVPPKVGDDFSDYRFLYQFYLALKERVCAINGGTTFPPANNSWYGGTVGTITDDGDSAIVTDTNPLNNYDSTVCVPGSAHRFTNYSCGSPNNVPNVPADYDLVIDGNPASNGYYLEPQWIVRVRIYRNDVTNLYTGSFQQFVEFRNIPSVQYLVGKPYLITKAQDIGGHGNDGKGLTWDQRLPDWTPSWLFDWGQITDGTVSSLTNTIGGWSKDRWIHPTPQDPGHPAGFDLLCQGDDGKWHRVQITGNTKDTLNYAGQGWKPSIGARWGIVGHGCIFKPEQVEGDLKRDILTGTNPPTRVSGTYSWYHGLLDDTYWSHSPNDGLGTTKTPALDFTHDEPIGEDGECEPETDPVFDRDWQYGEDEICTPGKSSDFIAYKYWSTVRSLQQFSLGLCRSFLDPTVNYSNYPYRNFDTMTEAELLKAANVNSYNTTVTSISGGNINYPSVDLPYTPIDVTWSILKKNGAKLSGRSTVATDGTIPCSCSDETCTLAGRPLILSIGFTRQFDKEFRWFNPATVFIPDYGYEDPGGGADPVFKIYDPPQDEDGKTGMYFTRGASTTYIDQTFDGFRIESDKAFQDGDHARWIGDNFNDPTLDNGDTVFCSDDGSRPGCKSPDTIYRDHLYDGQTRDYKNYGTTIASVEKGGTFHLTDSNANFWLDWWTRGHGTVANTINGTATGGSTTTLEDTSKATSKFWTTSDTSGRFIGFVLELTSGMNVGEKRPITAKAGTTLTFYKPFPHAIQAGDTYRIREPYRLNRYVGTGIFVRVFADDGTHKDAPILYHDDTTLFFDPASGVTVTDTSRYQILEFLPGTTFKRASGKWVIPTGTDTRANVPYSKSPSGNQPDHFTRYALSGAMKGDILAGSVFSELRKVIDALYKTIGGAVSWHSRANDAVPENNAKASGTSGSPGDTGSGDCTATTGDPHCPPCPGDSQCDCMYSYMQGEDSHNENDFENGGPPSLNRNTITFNTIVDSSMGVNRQYAYAETTAPCDKLSHTWLILVYGDFCGCVIETDPCNCVPQDGLCEGGCSEDPHNCDQCCEDGIGAPVDISVCQFDNGGDPVQNRAWSTLATEGPTTALTSPRIKCGSKNLPDPGPCVELATCPTDGIWTNPQGYSISHGYTVVDQISVIDWQPGFRFKP